MSNKPIVHYRPNVADYIRVGEAASVCTTDHWSYLVSNKGVVHTSKVLHYDNVTGVFETLNTVYKPEEKELCTSQ